MLERGWEVRLPRRACPFPLTFECNVGAVLLLAIESRVSYDNDETDADEREEKDSVDEGGDWGGRGMVAGSTLATILCIPFP